MKIFGFPEMDLLKGIRRSYPPHLISLIASSEKAIIYLEDGYGEDIGFNARTTASSYAWPSFGTNADRLNVEIYARQITPILQFLVVNGIEGIKPPEDFKTTALNNAIYWSQNPLEIDFSQKK